MAKETNYEMMQHLIPHLTPYECARIFEEAFGTEFVNGVGPDDRLADVVRWRLIDLSMQSCSRL